MLNKVYKGIVLMSVILGISSLNMMISYADVGYTNCDSEVYNDINNSEVIHNLQSGVEVEILENNQEYTYVQIDDVYGYIKSSCLSDTISFCDVDKEELLTFTEEDGYSLGYFELTSYCGCARCNGKWKGYPTAGGYILTENRTVAVDPGVIPLGSWIEINVPGIGWQKFRAEDTGSAVKGKHIDVYIGESHSKCINPYYNTDGVRNVEVKLLSK